MSTAKKPAKAPEDLQTVLQALIAQGRKDGMIQASELNSHLEKMDLSAEKIEEKVEETVEKAASKAKKAVRSAQKKVTAALVPEVYVQWDNMEISMANIIEKAKEDFKAEHSDLILSCRVYVKPQDNAAYYVINDVEGKVSL